MVYLLSSFVFRHVEAGGHVVSHAQMKNQMFQILSNTPFNLKSIRTIKILNRIINFTLLFFFFYSHVSRSGNFSKILKYIRLLRHFNKLNHKKKIETSYVSEQKNIRSKLKTCRDPMTKDFCSIHVLARIFIKMTQ